MHQHRQPFNRRSAAACFAADAAVVLLFVAVGRFSHGENISLAGMAGTGWPFAVGLVGGYVAIVFSRWPAVTVGGGLLISIKMLVVAMLLRAGVTPDQTPVAFLVVAAIFMIGGTAAWRALALRRLNGEWPRDTRTGIRRRSRLEALRVRIRPGRRTGIFDR